MIILMTVVIALFFLLFSAQAPTPAASGGLFLQRQRFLGSACLRPPYHGYSNA